MKRLNLEIEGAIATFQAHKKVCCCNDREYLWLNQTSLAEAEFPPKKKNSLTRGKRSNERIFNPHEMSPIKRNKVADFISIWHKH